MDLNDITVFFYLAWFVWLGLISTTDKVCVCVVLGCACELPIPVVMIVVLQLNYGWVL